MNQITKTIDIIAELLKKSSEKTWYYIGLIIVVSWVTIAALWNLQIGSLQPFDEAWYGTISRNLLSQANPWHLHFNQLTFYDHPPLGFQLKAISMALFGESSFSVRLPEVFAAVLSVALVYIVGRRLSSSWAGFWGAVILLSSRWFLFRARSGNLDVLLLATQLLVITALVFALFPTVKKKLKKNASLVSFAKYHIWFLLMWFFLGLSLLAKSLISLQLLPLVAIASLAYWVQQKYSIFSKETWLLVVGSILSILVPVLPWLLTYLNIDSKTFIQKQLTIGFRSGTEKSLNTEFISTAFQYFNAATHKWYKIMLASTGLAAGLLLFKKTRTKALILLLYVGLVAAPYVISEKTEVWHLIPWSGAMALLTGVSIDLILQKAADVTPSILKKVKQKISENTVVVGLFSARLIISVSILAIAAISYFSYWEGFISVFSYPADYEKITWHISHPNETLYTTMDAYFPGLVYYANLDQARVMYLSDDNFAKECRSLAKQELPFQAVARFGDWMTTQLGGDEYVTYREGGLVLIDMKPEECSEFADSILGPEIEPTIQQ